jgi:hypothetical protein
MGLMTGETVLELKIMKTQENIEQPCSNLDSHLDEQIKERNKNTGGTNLNMLSQ